MESHLRGGERRRRGIEFLRGNYPRHPRILIPPCHERLTQYKLPLCSGKQTLQQMGPRERRCSAASFTLSLGTAAGSSLILFLRCSYK